MTYADKLLADGESVVLRTRQHPLALIKDSRNGLQSATAAGPRRGPGGCCSPRGPGTSSPS